MQDTHTQIRIPTLGDEALDAAQIEGAAHAVMAICPHIEPSDAEPGEWLVLTDTSNGNTYVITITSE